MKSTRIETQTTLSLEQFSHLNATLAIREKRIKKLIAEASAAGASSVTHQELQDTLAAIIKRRCSLQSSWRKQQSEPGNCFPHRAFG